MWESPEELRQSPQVRSQLTGFDESSFEVKTIRHLGKQHPTKFDLPVTSQMDIGWLIQRPMKADTLRAFPDRGAVRWRQDDDAYKTLMSRASVFRCKCLR